MVPFHFLGFHTWSDVKVKKEIQLLFRWFVY